MLPPLRSTSGSGSSFQNHSTLASGGHQAAQAAYKVQLVDWKGDSNSSSAGKLNVLLLAGRERIADHLSMLADAVGEAIGLPRREGEGSGDYVLRLAEAVSRLGPRQRAEVERQLNLVVQGLKLRFLFEAFSNPAGPQAARIVAYMETARYKDRDLAARSVVTSYRQNDGTGTGQPAAPAASPAASQPAPAPAPRNAEPMPRQMAAQTPVRDATASSGQSEPDAPASAEPAKVTADASAPAKPETKADSRTETKAADRAGVAVETKTENEAGAEAESRFEVEIRAETGPETEASSSSLAEAAGAETEVDAGAETDDGIDARSLQTLLRRAFEGGDNGDAAIEAKATAELLSVEKEERNLPADPADDPLPFEDPDLAGYEMEDADPAERRAPEGRTPLRAWNGETPAAARQLAGRAAQAAMARPQAMPDAQAPARPSPAAAPSRASALSASVLSTSTLVTSASAAIIARAPAPAVRTPSHGADTRLEPTLFTLKGWKETEVEAKDIAMAYEAIVEDGEEAQTLLRNKAAVKPDGETARPAEPQAPQPDAVTEDWQPSLLRAQPKNGEARQPLAPQPESHAADITAEAIPGDDADPIYDPLSATGHTAQEAEDTLPARAAAPAPEKAAAEAAQPKAVPPAVIERQALAQLLPAARDMVPLALAPVSLRDDEFTEETQLDGRPFQRDDEEQEDAREQDGRQQDARENAAAAIEEEEDGDAAYELYQRMANWT